jgi:hypothetical protein
MTSDESKLALALVRATFLPGSYDKRFAAAMAAHASLDSEQAITAKQRLCLMQMAIRYRRQLPKEIVALANQMMLDDIAQEDQASPQGIIQAARYENPVHNSLPLPG